MLIFVADDVELNIKVLKRVIATVMPEAVVCGFADGEEALANIRGRPCDILFTDVEMPRMNGLALAEAVHAEFPETEIFFVTGENGKSLEQMGIPLERCIFKPANPETLARRLAQLPRLRPFVIAPPER